MTIALFHPPSAASLSSVSKATQFMGQSKPARSPAAEPSLTFHKRAVLSSDTVTRSLPSRVDTQPVTGSVWSFKTWILMKKWVKDRN